MAKPAIKVYVQHHGNMCRLTHKFAKTGRYASEEENGEDMCQIGLIPTFMLRRAR